MRIMFGYLVPTRNFILSFIYKYFLKVLFFKIPPESMHDSMVNFGSFLGKFTFTKKITSALFNYQNPMLKQKILGISFENPVGLSAGFDKDANLMDILPSAGFGFEEIGSVTAKPYPGNPGIRLFRLPNSRSLGVNYGLKSQGALKISRKLKNRKFKFPIGISIAKTNSTETVDEKKAIEDYVEGFKHFTKIGDASFSYFTLNISCPNTFGGQPFHNSKMLDNLLKQIDKIPTKKPIFIKFSPDLTDQEVDGIIKVCDKHRVHGFIMGNLTKNRKSKKIRDKKLPEKGGLSGKVVEELSNNLIKYLYQKTKGGYVIIGCGGVFRAEDAYKKIKLGASLIQLITGMIYQGPQTISEINLGLVRLLKDDGYSSISEAVGSGFLEKTKPTFLPFPEAALN